MCVVCTGVGEQLVEHTEDGGERQRSIRDSHMSGYESEEQSAL